MLINRTGTFLLDLLEYTIKRYEKLDKYEFTFQLYN